MIKSPIITGIIFILTNYFIILPALFFTSGQWFLPLDLIVTSLFISIVGTLYSLNYKKLINFKYYMKFALIIFFPILIGLVVILLYALIMFYTVTGDNSIGVGWVIIVALILLAMLFGITTLNCFILFLSNIISFYSFKVKENNLMDIHM